MEVNNRKAIRMEIAMTTKFIEQSRFIKAATFEKNSDNTIQECVEEFLDYTFVSIKQDPVYRIDVIKAISSYDEIVELVCRKFKCPVCGRWQYEVHFWDNASALTGCENCNAMLEW